MPDRIVFLDTETTGLDFRNGHKIIEIGCVECIDRQVTQAYYHQYINPERDIHQEAIEIHGITNERVANEPVFTDIADAFIEFIRGAELIIHNAPFDVGFLNHELQLAGCAVQDINDICEIKDSLVLARNKHPGMRNSLDALCKRYYINNAHRTLHGALLDSEILADVYLAMTGGQESLSLSLESSDNTQRENNTSKNLASIPAICANESELSAHLKKLESLQKISGASIWLAQNNNENSTDPGDGTK
ncbi:MAG: DNA polymerase III subunit epsilon [bacterium]